MNNNIILGLFVIFLGVTIWYGLTNYSAAQPAPAPIDTLLVKTRAIQRDQHHPLEDDPTTTNDESNDQPLGHFGTTSVEACTPHNGSCYTLDADVDGAPSTLYFPKGGNVDLDSCDDYGDGQFTCQDENGREWEIQAEYY